MKTPKPLIIAYDISENRIRNQVFNLLKQWRLDGQKSVHECQMTTFEAKKLFNKIKNLIDEQKDFLLMAWLTPNRAILTCGKRKKRITDNLLHFT